MSRRPYTPKMTYGWWLDRPFYTRYMIRELSSAFVTAYSGLLIVGLWRLAEGEAAWNGYVSALSHPAALVFQGVALLFALYHTVTWFAVTPRTTPVIVGEDFLPPQPVIIAQYAAWIFASAVIIGAALWF